LSTWLDQKLALTSADLDQLRPHLLLLADEILSTSAPDAAAVLTQLNSGGFLVEYRAQLKDTLLRLAEGTAPLSARAVRHLRPSDGPAAQEFLRQALSRSLTRDDAFHAIVEDASEASRSILENYERHTP